MTDETQRDQTADRPDDAQTPEADLPQVPAVPTPPDVTAEATGGAGASAPAPPVAGPLTPADQARVSEIAKQVDVTDAAAVIQYGLPAQSRIATFADSLLGDVRNKDAGIGGEALTDLLKKVRELDIDALSPSGKARIPIVGRFSNAFNRFATKYQKVAGSIDRIVDALERSRMGLLKDMTVLDKMYELNLEYLKQLDVYIAAGEQALEHFNTVKLPELEVEARTSEDPLAAQRLADFQQAVTRFERRLHDLKLTRTIAVQTAPQIRLIQSNDQNLVEKIQSSILTTIPLWKNQIVIAISLYRQQKAAELQKEVTDTANELLAKNAELLKSGSAKVAREVERGIVDIEVLKKANDDL
ncbi:MAG TPA: toxic anion resistance protein, partial [Thermoleophilia bacterium]|nr:toxic anion resistance protein [Thermoleophilia bacterium]